MEVGSVIIAGVVSLLVTPFAIAMLGQVFRPRGSDLVISDNEIIKRNGSAYHAAGLCLVCGWLWPVVYDQQTGAGISGLNVLALSLSSSVILPILFLWLRSAIFGKSLSEYVRYVELVDGVSSKGQIVIAAVFGVAALCASIFAIAKLV